MTQKEDIRPIYSQLQGYLSQAPERNYTIYDSCVWEDYNEAINELNKVSAKDYNRFKIQPTRSGSGSFFVEPLTFRNKLGGIISRLHGEFFPDEPPPFAGMPTTIISQTQQQSQSFQVQMLLEIQSKIDEQLHKLDPGDKKRSFLEKVKGTLKSVRNTAELIALILATGQDFGLTFEELKELFK